MCSVVNQDTEVFQMASEAIVFAEGIKTKMDVSVFLERLSKEAK